MLKNEKNLARVFHYDVFGKREDKYAFLNKKSISSIDWKDLELKDPHFYFVYKNLELTSKGIRSFSVNQLFLENSLGIEFGSKQFFLSQNKDTLQNAIKNILLNDLISDSDLSLKYSLKSTNGWRFNSLRSKEIKACFKPELIMSCLNSPFCSEFTYHSAILRRPQLEVLRHMHYPNIALLLLRQSRASERGCVFVTNQIYSKDAISIVDRVTGFPLYIYSDSEPDALFNKIQRRPNLNYQIVMEIAAQLCLNFVPEKETDSGTFAPIDLLDYIYAVLHSPTYRDTYKEFLKIDFPRVPYPPDADTFWKLVKLGGELRQIHLLESPTVEQYITTYPQDGTNEVVKIKYENQHVWINDTQYFAGVPQTAWEFYIGGYQPAQKWLKDRKSRVLSYEDVRHYQKIIVALSETDRLMHEIGACSDKFIWHPESSLVNS